MDYSEKCFAKNLIKRFWSCGRKLSYKRKGKEAAHHLQPLILQILSRLQFSPPSTESRKEELHRHNYTFQLSLSLKACLTWGSPKQFRSRLVKIVIAILSNSDIFPAGRAFQLARSVVTGPASRSTRRGPYKGGERFPLTFAFLQWCPVFPRSPALRSSAILTPNYP